MKKPTAASKSGYAVLLPFLQKQGRTVERALDDSGNCLFRSLSLQLTGTQDHHIKLRKVIAKFEQTEGVFEIKLHKTSQQDSIFKPPTKNQKDMFF